MDISHDIFHHRLFTVINGVTAYVEYGITPAGELNILHTIVPPPLEGQGIASRLVQATYDYARSENLTPVATCSYAQVWLRRHPDYARQL